MDPIFCKQYDAYNILLGTGLRISEFIGLTVHDLDMQNCIIHVNHQLTLARDRTFHVTKPKSWHSIRDIYMGDSVYPSFQCLVEEAKSRKVKIMIDGYCDFLQVSREGTIRARRNFNLSLTSAVKKYNRLHPDTPLPRISPHTFRHTFCTNMANRGIDIKSLQYLMGHSNVAITLNVYTHANANTAVQQMARLVEFTPTGSSSVLHVG
jgi:integrase